ncbi:MAG: hypothetical protein AB2A00_34025 [Myxococcota bacterium]
MNKEELKRRTDEALNNMRRIRDEIRVDLHLASMDLKDRWTELEPRLAQAEKLAEEISDTSRKAVEEVVAKAKELRNAMKGQRNGKRPHA